MTRPHRPDLLPLPPPAHLALGNGETHEGYFTDCEACRLYRAENPGARVPWEKRRGVVNGEER